MTYCCGILVRDGLVMIADTRTNAGLDNVSVFRKLHIFSNPGQLIMAIASSGNLSLTQSVISTLNEGMENPETGQRETLMNAPTMFQAAQRIGRAIRMLHDIEGKVLDAADVKFDLAFLFGGQIKGERMRLFMIYAAGNFIECTTDTPYLQIGEHKYGKPVLDRAITYDIDLYDALKIALVSVDSTMRSNLSVGMPLDLLVARRDACQAELSYRIEPGSRISRICASAGRRRCARRTTTFRARPTPRRNRRTRGANKQWRNAMAQSQKIALVTGAGTGVGRAAALALAKAGFTVVLAGRRKDKLDEVAKEAAAFGGKTLAVPADIADPASIKALFAKAMDAFGRLDVLFNNAGVGAPAVPIEDLPFDKWKAAVDTNLTGTFLCIQEAIRIMKDQTPRGGRIINNGSISAHTPRPLTIAYTATKHAITGLTKSVALDGRAYDIACGQIDIGNAVSPMTERMVTGDGLMQAHGQRMIEPRMEAEHVGDAVVYMANLPLATNVLFMTVMATKMPFVGRG